MKNKKPDQSKQGKLFEEKDNKTKIKFNPKWHEEADQ